MNLSMMTTFSTAAATAPKKQKKRRNQAIEFSTLTIFGIRAKILGLRSLIRVYPHRRCGRGSGDTNKIGNIGNTMALFSVMYGAATVRTLVCPCYYLAEHFFFSFVCVCFYRHHYLAEHFFFLSVF